MWDEVFTEVVSSTVLQQRTTANHLERQIAIECLIYNNRKTIELHICYGMSHG